MANSYEYVDHTYDVVVVGAGFGGDASEGVESGMGVLGFSLAQRRRRRRLDHCGIFGKGYQIRAFFPGAAHETAGFFDVRREFPRRRQLDQGNLEAIAHLTGRVRR